MPVNRIPIQSGSGLNSTGPTYATTPSKVVGDGDDDDGDLLGVVVLLSRCTVTGSCTLNEDDDAMMIFKSF